MSELNRRIMEFILNLVTTVSTKLGYDLWVCRRWGEEWDGT
jgi:hypothetical protein